MLEYFPEPEERIVIANCCRCGDEIYDGDEVVESGGYICQDCKKAEAFKQATKSDLKEFITSCNHEEEFIEWFFELEEK
jgi:hypothetical protein